MKLLFLAIGICVTVAPPSNGQIVRPLERVFVSPTPPVTFWGQGRTQSANDVNPLDAASGKFIVTIEPVSRVRLFVAGNKGAGLESVSADSFEIKSIVFPEISNRAFLSKAELKLFGSSDSRARRSGKYNELFAFTDYAYQFRAVSKSDEDGESRDLRIESSTFFLGFGWSYTLRRERAPFRITVMPSYMSLQISDGSVGDYRAITSNPEQEDVLRGGAIKVAIQYNDFSFEFGYTDLFGSDGDTVPGLSGGLFSLAFTATGKLLEIE